MIEKNIFITGGSRGIGEGIALAAANAGLNVILTFSKNQKNAVKVCEALTVKGVRARAIQMQVENRESVRNAISIASKEIGEINILVNNAGIAQEKPFETITDKDWDQMMAVNLRGPFTVTQEVLPSMINNKWGRIINIASIGGQWGGFNQVHYAAAKAGLINFTRSIAKIYSQHGITSNAIAPGLIATEMSAAELETEAGKQKLVSIPVNKIGSVDDVGSAVVYLASNEAHYITGQTININGGLYFS
jgi:NAD(P)-dependent dehydrogenase (short-subunit alcohol dehydrogenase family)